MITVSDYMMGRDVTHALECSPAILREAALTVDIVNELLDRARLDGLVFDPVVSSGWRPPSINARILRAAKHSLHMTGQAIDLQDTSGALDAWCVRHAESDLRFIGLWLEDPVATPTWCHLQTKPPRSGARIFKP